MLVSESSAMHQLLRRSAQKPQPDLIADRMPLEHCAALPFSNKMPQCCGHAKTIVKGVLGTMERRVRLSVCLHRARFLEQGVHTSWEALHRQLSTHQVVTVRLPTTDAQAFTIRRDTRPKQIHRNIYRVLRVPDRILSPITRWTHNSH
jgi:hypothetical protein